VLAFWFALSELIIILRCFLSLFFPCQESSLFFLKRKSDVFAMSVWPIPLTSVWRVVAVFSYAAPVGVFLVTKWVGFPLTLLTGSFSFLTALKA